MSDKTASLRRTVRLLTVGLVLVATAGLLALFGPSPLGGVPGLTLSSVDGAVILLGVALVVFLVELSRHDLRGGASRGRVIPPLERELREHIDDDRLSINAYRTDLKGHDGPLETHAKDKLEQMERNLKIAGSRLSNHEYRSAFARYYLAQRGLVDVAPALVHVDRTESRTRNRFAELVEQVRSDAAHLSDPAVERHIRADLAAYDDTDDADPTDIDRSPLKIAMRRLHDANLRELVWNIRLRWILGFVNTAMALTIAAIVAVTVGLVALNVFDPVLFTRFLSPFGSDDPLPWLLFTPLTLAFGALGALFSVLYRFGLTSMFGGALSVPELPDEVVMRPSLAARILWGSLAAFVVLLFLSNSLNGTFEFVFVVVTSIVAGFSERLLDSVLDQHEKRVLPRDEEDDSTADRPKPPADKPPHVGGGAATDGGESSTPDATRTPPNAGGREDESVRVLAGRLGRAVVDALRRRRPRA